MSQRADTFAFAGGLDTNSAALAVPPGAIISGMNYEPLAEGYGRVKGYERFDGQTAPSQAAFWTLPFDAGVSAFTYGDVVEGDTSGATGIVISDPAYGLTGSWGGSDAAGTLVLVNVQGTFENNELLLVGATLHAVAAGTATQGSAPTVELAQAWLLDAVAWHRAQIQKVPGEGPVRGVAVHDGTVYAWRDTIGSTHLRCYRATDAGWVAVGTLYRMDFTAGATEIVAGDTITGATSGATATVVHVELTEGTWNGSGVGFLFLKGVSGTFVSENIKVGVPVMAAGGAVVSQFPAAGGRVRWLSHNFYGAANRYRLYGANGTGKAFCLFNEDGMALIATGMVEDKPERVFEIGNHLGLTFPGGSIQFSGTGVPHVFLVLLGAGEFGFGTEVTDVVQANETAVAFFGVSKIGILQGHDSEDFLLDILTEEAGAEPDTAQRIAKTVYIDKRGLRSLEATQAYGNFKAGSLSGQIERYFRVKRDAGVQAIGTYVCKNKSQYRIVWDDGTGLAVYMGGKTPEAIPFSFEITPFCFGGGELDDGEGIFVGGEDGYVYRIDSGNSFDGEPIKGFVMTGFNTFRAPLMEDRFHGVLLELDAPAQANIGIAVQYDYGDGQQPNSGNKDFTVMGGAGSFLVNGGGGVWDSAAWNEFYWSAPIESQAWCPIDGLGCNASFIFATEAGLTEDPHTLQAYTVYRSPRKFRRGR